MEHADILIIGAGPAGLALAACLKRRGVDFVIVERGPSVATSWRNHYERLHLHTVKELSGLPYLGFAREVARYPSRDEVVAYLEGYRSHFELPVRCDTEVKALHRDEEAGHWVAATPKGNIAAKFVVVATSQNGSPRIPDFTGMSDFEGDTVHSRDYKNGAPWRDKSVLVVGAGNSGAEIAVDLCEHGAASVALCVRSPVYFIPRDLFGFLPGQKTTVMLSGLPMALRDALGRLASWLSFRDLARYGVERPQRGPISMIDEDDKVPILDVGTADRIRCGDILVVPGIDRFGPRTVSFVDGRALTIDAVVWATGFDSGLDRWVDGGAALLDARGYPRPRSGLTALDGLYVIGYQNPSTGSLRQIAIDAQALADQLAGRAGQAQA